jgi:hypothetical protein
MSTSSTTGSIAVDLNNFGDMVNSASGIGAGVTGGVSDQGDLIGLAIGLSIAIGLLFGVVILLLGFIVTLIRRTKAIKKA